MASIFSKIAAGEIPSYKVAATDSFYAFLDINPLKKGHVLVIPRKEVDYLFDLDTDTYTELFAFVKKVALAVEKAIPCLRVGIAVIGLEVPHAHVHLVPLDGPNDLNFSNKKLSLSTDEFEEIATKISRAYTEL